MRTYGQYCPIAKAAEIIGDRWTLLILRDMHTGALKFNELHRGLPGISRSVLTQRLRQLERDGLIERHLDPRGRTMTYALAAPGDDLASVLAALTDWVNRWVIDDPTPAELDPRLLMLWFSRVIDPAAIGEGRLVIEFQLSGPRRSRSWLVLEEGEVSLCLDDPMLDVDLLVTADTATLYRVFMGRQQFTGALSDGTIEVTGATAMRRSFIDLVDQTSPQYMRSRKPS